MKAIFTFILMIVISSGTYGQEHKHRPSSSTSHSEHTLIDFTVKSGSVWATTLHEEAHDVRENLYEVELDLVHGHIVYSVVGNMFKPSHNASGENPSGFGCGIMIGKDWENKHSVIEFKAGPTLVWSEFCSVVPVVNSHEDIQPSAKAAEEHELTEYFAPGGLIDLCYKYKASKHLNVGVDVPFSFNHYFYGHGVSLSVGYVL